MPFYQRAFLYLFRKRAKTILLFLILLLVSSMILGTVMILHAAQTTRISMEQKSKAKAVCEITQDKDPDFQSGYFCCKAAAPYYIPEPSGRKPRLPFRFLTYYSQ